MKRRHFLQWGAALALGGLAAVRVLARPTDRILVVGGGILGASICYQLARRGAQVTLLEKAQPAAGASGKSFAWINANISKLPREYHTLNRLGVHAFRSLHQQVGPALPVRWGGTLEWYGNEPRAGELGRLAKQQQSWGYPIRLIDATEFARREPRVVAGKSLVSAYTEQEGAVDSAQATRVLLRLAQEAGATIVYPCAVDGIAPQSRDGVTLHTSQGEFHGDRVVLACGVDTPQLAALVDVKVPLKPAPGIVVRSTPQPQWVNGVLVTEDSHFHQQTDGRVVMGDDFDPPATQPHRLLTEHPSDFPRASLARKHGERIRGQAARYLPALASAEIESVSLCWRPMPADGFPIIGYAPRAPQVYVAVTHSGVTLGPLFGELAAIELLDGVEVDLLSPYRLARFTA